MSAPVRLAVIGCGTWGRNYILSAIEAGNCVVTHIAGGPDANGRIHCPPTGCRIVPSRQWQRLLDAPVDAFVVATPPDVRPNICVELLKAGRPVLAEKPVALELNEALRVSRAAESAGVPFLVAHQHLFATAYEELLELVDGWRLQIVSSAGGGQGPARTYSALWDYGPHDASMFVGLGAGLDDIDVLAAERRAGMFRLALRRQRGGGIVRVWNDRAPKVRTFSVTGDRGDVTYHDSAPNGARLRLNGEPIAVAYEPPLTRTVRAFAAAVAGGHRDWRMHPGFGREVTRVLAIAEAMTRTKENEKHV